MAKAAPQLDVLVLGDHPAAYFAAALLRDRGKLSVLHSTIPGEDQPDRLMLVNPRFFILDKMLHGLRRKVRSIAIFGAQFLSNIPGVRSEHRSKSAMGHILSYNDIRNAVRKLAEARGADFISPKSLEIHRLDEQGVDLIAGRMELRPRMLLVGGPLPPHQQRLLGMPESWGEGLLHRYSFVRLRGKKSVRLGTRPLVPMSLDLDGTLHWAWLLPGPTQVQLAVQQPIESVAGTPPSQQLKKWAQTLAKHEIVDEGTAIAVDAMQWLDVPLAGALAHEGVANRTLLIGPAGGFYSASGEDLYPNCWSAVHAVEVIRKALKERHLQDALQPYRQKWRTTLGDYLRGPQQNLRFLMPLVYRNQVMTTRMTESILLGKSVVR